MLREVRLFKMRFPIGVMWSILLSEHRMETREHNAYSMEDQRNYQIMLFLISWHVGWADANGDGDGDRAVEWSKTTETPFADGAVVIWKISAVQWARVVGPNQTATDYPNTPQPWNKAHTKRLSAKLGWASSPSVGQQSQWNILGQRTSTSVCYFGNEMMLLAMKAC